MHGLDCWFLSINFFYIVVGITVRNFILDKSIIIYSFWTAPSLNVWAMAEMPWHAYYQSFKIFLRSFLKLILFFFNMIIIIFIN